MKINLCMAEFKCVVGKTLDVSECQFFLRDGSLPQVRACAYCDKGFCTNDNAARSRLAMLVKMYEVKP